MVHDDNDGGSQQFIPPSFLALYLAPGRTRPSATRAVIGTRYDHCEDLATALVELADTQRWSLGLDGDSVLERVWRGLLAGQGGQGEQTGLSPAEARWVLQRLAELLGWPAWLPPEDAAGVDPGPT